MAKVGQYLDFEKSNIKKNYSEWQYLFEKDHMV